MEMNKMFTGLIALVAGVALSAGSAFATAGYVGGDPARMKLVPYFETGENKATIIGIQNMSPQETDTMMKNQRVADLQAYMAGEDPSTALVDDTTDAITAVAGTPLDMTSLDSVAAVEAALETAMMAVQTEHLFVLVNVYDAMGMMMENASASLCLAENQFGYVILQGFEMMSWQEHIPFRSAILSVPDGDIPPYGYAEIVAESAKFSGCEDTSRTERIARIATRADLTMPVSVSNAAVAAQSMVAAWTIIQDTGGGFFGTEVPTSTISKEMTGNDVSTANVMEMGDPEIACYMSPDVPPTDSGTPTAVAGVAANRSGPFQMTRCGLIPERHDNARVTDDENAATLAPFADTATPRAHAFARYDAGDESMVYVWLAEGMDMEGDHPSMARMLDVVVKCEDGMVMTGMDQYGDPTTSIQVAAPVWSP